MATTKTTMGKAERNKKHEKKKLLVPHFIILCHVIVRRSDPLEAKAAAESQNLSRAHFRFPGEAATAGSFVPA